MLWLQGSKVCADIYCAERGGALEWLFSEIVAVHFNTWSLDAIAFRKFLPSYLLGPPFMVPPLMGPTPLMGPLLMGPTLLWNQMGPPLMGPPLWDHLSRDQPLL